MKIIEFDKDEIAQQVRVDVKSLLSEPPVSKPIERPSPPSRNVKVSRASDALRMHVLDLGKLRLDKNFMVANSTVATARTPNPPGKLIDVPVSAYLIEHPDGNVLFDTGCHPDWGGSRGRWPQATQEIFPVIGGKECMLPARLEALGIGPDQIRHVVLSHLHCDHAGCVEYFRKSNLIVHEDEFAGAYTHFATRDESTPYIVQDLERWSKLDLNWRRIGRGEPDRDLVKGVKLLNFGSGHSYGMLGLQVSLRSQNGVLLVSDACYTAENYGPPARAAGIGHDSLGAKRTLERIRALAEGHNHDVWYGHDAEQFEALRKASEGCYE